MKAKVLQSTGSWYIVRNEKGDSLHCRLPGKFKLETQKTTNPIAVGDEVIIGHDTQTNDYIIEEILPRKNYIVRQSPRQKHLKHIIASNIEQAIIIVTISKPRTSLGFIDRFLVTAESYHIPVTIVVNKIDLMTKKDELVLKQIQEIYPPLGYPIILCSATRKDGIQEIIDLLQNKSTLVVGHSGVGKSTTINAINSDLHLKTAPLSNKWNKGTHTTTFATMYEILPDSYIIDTPGIKELFVIEIEPEELSGYFPEMKALSNKCQYNNCLHENEPHCAVKDALINDKIPESRIESYLSILENIRSVDYWER
jgi:ribosome biogenesis GTPase